MLVISSREFRANQKKYLDQIDSGEEIIIQRGSNKSYKLVPVKTDDTLMSKSEFLAVIDRGIMEIEQGKTTTINNKEELRDFLDSL